MISSANEVQHPPAGLGGLVKSQLPTVADEFRSALLDQLRQQAKTPLVERHVSKRDNRSGGVDEFPLDRSVRIRHHLPAVGNQRQGVGDAFPSDLEPALTLLARGLQAEGHDFPRALDLADDRTMIRFSLPESLQDLVAAGAGESGQENLLGFQDAPG